MSEISKELEDRIKELISKGKPIDAVSLVHQELKLGLRVSKEIVDKYRSEYK